MKALFRHQHRAFTVFVSVLMLSLALAACGSSANNGGSSGGGGTTASGGNGGKGCKKIGVLLPDTASSARWDGNDKPALESGIPKALSGATVDYYNANGSAATQQNQA